MARKTQIQTEGVSIVGVDEEGQIKDTSALEKAGVAFDPARMPMDLTKEEKRRSTALLFAIQAYQNLIIKDAEMYIAISRDTGREGGPTIKPATMEAMVIAAIQFDDFISGKLQAEENQEPLSGTGEGEAQSVEKI